MGAIYQVTCQACAYADRVKVGGSMSTYMVDSPFPVLCPKCSTVSTTNERASSGPACSRCGETEVTVYGSETLGEVPSDRVKWIDRGQFSSSMLTLGPHQCPKCNEKTMGFRCVMRFD